MQFTIELTQIRKTNLKSTHQNEFADISKDLCQQLQGMTEQEANEFYGKKAWDKLGLEYVAYFSAD